MKKIEKILAAALVLVMATVLCAFGVSAGSGVVAVGAATVNTSALNIRSGPSTDYDRVGVLSADTIVVVLEKTSDEWYKINYNGTVGYVASEYLTDITAVENFKATGQVNDNDGVYMRTGPSTDYDYVTAYYEGTTVSVIGINNGWYKVVTEDGTGYMRSDFVDITSGGPSYSSNQNESSSIGQEIANYALQFVGYNYVYGAESPSDGFDCSGLVYYVYGQFGYSLHRGAGGQYLWDGRYVAKSELQQGDLVFFSEDGSDVSHVGIYIGSGQFVHASNSRTGVIISDLNSSYYTSVYFSARRIVG